MRFIILPIEEAAEVFTPEELEYARKSVDGTQVIMHEEILLQRKTELGFMTLPESGVAEWTYPVYDYASEELNTLLDSESWSSEQPESQRFRLNHR